MSMKKIDVAAIEAAWRGWHEPAATLVRRARCRNAASKRVARHLWRSPSFGLIVHRTDARHLRGVERA
jgi:hypothetical protein